MGLNSQRYSRVNIVSNDYARYGTSVYQKLYSRKEGETSYGTHGYARHNDDASVTGSTRSKCESGKNAVTSPIVSRDENALVKTCTFGSSTTNTTGGGNEGSLNEDGKSLDTVSMVDCGDTSSKRSKIKRKYKSLISSSSKKLINKLHEHGSSDTFSIFSLRTSQSHKHELLKSEHTIYERRCLPDAKFEALPVEVVANILLMLDNKDQKTLVNCLYVSKFFYRATKMVLYRAPAFTSTYRVAQFVTTLRLHPENGKYVRILDLSMLRNGLCREQPGKDNDGAEPSEENPELLCDSSFDEENFDLALAGWRDWRYRHDPLYGATVLNSFNLKKVVSRSSSISSQATSSVASSPNVANGHVNGHPAPSRPRGHRSNSSVSSFTSSIMSSFQNNSHISLVTTSSTNNSTGHITNSNRPENGTPITRKKSIKTSTTLDNPISKVDNQNSNRESIWLKLKQRTKNRRALKAKRIPKIADATVTEENNDLPRKNTLIKFNVQQPFRTSHPYTNKFLLKYAPYRDLPIGYILHMLKLCPNITHLDLSYLVFCTDFEILAKKPSKIMNCSSLLPAVQESVVSTSKSEAELEVIYLTDSNKNFDYYNEPSRSRSSTIGQSPSSFLTASCNKSDYPPPIDGQLKRKNSYRQNNNDVQLRKLNPAEIFEYLCHNQNNSYLENIKMDGIVWCRQSMIKYFVMKTFKENSGKDMSLSFEKAGLNMNLVWTCDGKLNDFVSLLVMEHVHQMDDISLRELFSISAGSLGSCLGQFHILKDPDIIEISTVFALEYGLASTEQQTINFRLTILRSERPTSYRIRNITANYVSLVVSFCLHDNGGERNRNTESEIHSEPSKRLDHLTHEITARVCELRNADLRRNIGENNYIMEDAY